MGNGEEGQRPLFQHREKPRKRAAGRLVGNMFGWLVLIPCTSYYYVAILRDPIQSPSVPPERANIITANLMRSTTTGIGIFVGVAAFLGIWFVVDLAAAIRLFQATKQNVDPRVALRQLKFWQVYWPIGNGISVLVILGLFIVLPSIFLSIFESRLGLMFPCFGLLFIIMIVFNCQSSAEDVERYAIELEVAVEKEKIAKRYSDITNDE